MKAGDLRHRITFQYQTKVSDGMGAWTTAWVDAATVWAAIWPVSANEQIQAQAPVMIVSHRIRIRFRRNIKASWRVRFGLRYFNIISIINPNEKSELLDLMCKEAA